MHSIWAVLYFYHGRHKSADTYPMVREPFGGLCSLFARVPGPGCKRAGHVAASPLGQPAFDICSALTTKGPDASAHNNGTDPSGHPLQCPYCFVAAQCTAHPTMVGNAKIFPAFAGRGVAAALYASVKYRAAYGRLSCSTSHLTTDFLLFTICSDRKPLIVMNLPTQSISKSALLCDGFHNCAPKVG
jgi:hypothetical protein